MPARSEHATNFRERSQRIGHVPDDAVEQHRVERAVTERKQISVGRNPRWAGRFSRGLTQHAEREVCAVHTPSARRGDRTEAGRGDGRYEQAERADAERGNGRCE